MRHYLRFALLGSLLAIGGFGMTPIEPSPPTRDEQQVFTLGEWRVKEGHQADFVAAWKDVGAIFSRLQRPPTGKGLLVQSTSDPTLFYSFGPWRSAEDVAAMRADPSARAGIERLRNFCVVATPGTFRVVAESP
jgi:hypothetical protein